MVTRLVAPSRAPGVGLPGPVLVVRLDVDGPLPALSPVRVDGGAYVGAWVVVVRDGRPLGHVEVDFVGGVVGPEALRARVVAGLGDVFSCPAGRGVAADGVLADGLLPAVSVVVPSTFERVELLQRCVGSLVAQDYPEFEVIVVDNRPEDSAARRELWERLCVDGRVSVVAEDRPGSSAARNRGVSVARGGVVAFTDDDVVVESGWLRALGSRFAAEPETDCVTGLVLPKELETPAQIWFERSGSKLEQQYVLTHFANDGSWRGSRTGRLSRRRFEVTARRDDGTEERLFVYRGKFGMAANIAMRTEAFRALGGFDEALGAGIPSGGGEELHLLSRLVFAGQRLTLDPAIAIYHAHRSDYEDLRRRMFGYGAGYTAMLAALVRSNPHHLVGLFWYSLQAFGLVRHRSSDRRGGDYPVALSRSELRGLLHGPWRYLVSRRLMRRHRGAGLGATVPGAV